MFYFILILIPSFTTFFFLKVGPRIVVSIFSGEFSIEVVLAYLFVFFVIALNVSLIVLFKKRDSLKDATLYGAINFLVGILMKIFFVQVKMLVGANIYGWMQIVFDRYYSSLISFFSFNLKDDSPYSVWDNPLGEKVSTDETSQPVTVKETVMALGRKLTKEEFGFYGRKLMAEKYGDAFMDDLLKVHRFDDLARRSGYNLDKFEQLTDRYYKLYLGMQITTLVGLIAGICALGFLLGLKIDRTREIVLSPDEIEEDRLAAEKLGLIRPDESTEKSSETSTQTSSESSSQTSSESSSQTSSETSSQTSSETSSQTSNQSSRQKLESDIKELD